MLLLFNFVFVLSIPCIPVISSKCDSDLGEDTKCSLQKPLQAPHKDLESHENTTNSKNAAGQQVAANKTCKNGTVFCNVQCSQGKIEIKSTACCKCTCKIGYSLNSDGVHCDEASWTTWSGWTTCITSPWGGLQQRARVCKAGVAAANGRCFGQGSEGRTCSTVTANFRVRKNVRNLTDYEFHDLLQAFDKFKKDLSSDGYMYIAKWHGWPYECPWYKKYVRHAHGHCSWHRHPMFFAWHRFITVQLEMGLHKHMKNKHLGIPYWDWLEDGWNNLPELVKDSYVFDPILKRYMKNPFYRTYLYDHPLENNKTVYTRRLPVWNGLSLNKLMMRAIIRGLTARNYEEADIYMERPHNQIHDCLCENEDNPKFCKYSMLNTMYAIFDPIFLLHHSQVDRIYSLYRDVHLAAGDLDWTNSSIVGSYAKAGHKMSVDIAQSFQWPMSPFCNASMNTNPVTMKDGVWTLKNSLYGEQLFGFVYDNLDIGGRSWRGIVADLKAKQKSQHFGLDMPFVSFADPNLGWIEESTTYLKKCTDSDHFIPAR